MLKLARRARGHFVTLIEIRVHLIRVKPWTYLKYRGRKNELRFRSHGGNACQQKISRRPACSICIQTLLDNWPRQ